MKITLFIRSLGVGGAERQFVELSKELRRCGVQVATIVAYGGGSFARELEEYHIPYQTLGKTRRWGFVQPFLRLAKYLCETKPEVLYAFQAMPNIYSVPFRLLTPWLTVIWGVRSSNMDTRVYGPISTMVSHLEAFLSSCAHGIISNSEFGKTIAIKNGFPSEKFHVVPNGIDTQRFKPDQSARLRVRSKLCIKESDIVIGRVGRLDPMKDYPTFLHAASLLAKADCRLRFLCVGGGPKEMADSLVKKTNELQLSKKVLWLGPQANVEEYYNASDVIVSSSAFGEGFPNVLGEAMACARFCVATDVGDSKALIRRADALVPPNSPHALAEAVAAAVRQLSAANNREDNGAREYIEARFSLATLGARTIDAVRVTIHNRAVNRSHRNRKWVNECKR